MQFTGTNVDMFLQGSPFIKLAIIFLPKECTKNKRLIVLNHKVYMHGFYSHKLCEERVGNMYHLHTGKNEVQI